MTTYTFNSDMVAFNREVREFYEGRAIPRDTFREAVEVALDDMNVWGLMEFKQDADKKFSTVSKQLFSGIEKVIFEKVIESEERGGITADALTRVVNQKLRQVTGCSDDVVNYRITFKILSKMLNQNKIYKTLDKLIFPNVLR